MVLYQLSDLLLVYRYFRYEYYIVAIAVFALIAGVVLANKYHQEKALELLTNNPLESLTAKELLILGQITEGKTNKEIAVLNYVEISTVKTHINNIFSKLSVKNRKEASKVHLHYAEFIKSTLSPPAQI